MSFEQEPLHPDSLRPFQQQLSASISSIESTSTQGEGTVSETAMLPTFNQDVESPSPCNAVPLLSLHGLLPSVLLRGRSHGVFN